MKHVDQLIVGRTQNGLTLEMMENFLHKWRKWHCVLRYDGEQISEDQSVYSVFLCCDMWQAPELEIDHNNRWDLAEKNPELRRDPKKESSKEWHRRVDRYIKQQGYVVDNEGTAHWLALSEHYGEHKLKNYSTVQIDGIFGHLRVYELPKHELERL